VRNVVPRRREPSLQQSQHHCATIASKNDAMPREWGMGWDAQTSHRWKLTINDGSMPKGWGMGCVNLTSLETYHQRRIDLLSTGNRAAKGFPSLQKFFAYFVKPPTKAIQAERKNTLHKHCIANTIFPIIYRLFYSFSRILQSCLQFFLDFTIVCLMSAPDFTILLTVFPRCYTCVYNLSQTLQVFTVFPRFYRFYNVSHMYTFLLVTAILPSFHIYGFFL